MVGGGDMEKGILRYALKEGITDEELLPHFIAMHGLSGQGGRVAAANIPKQYRDVLIKDSVVRESEPELYTSLDRYIKTFSKQFEGEQIRGLYLYSPKSGNGKTSTAAALLNEFIVRHYVGSIKRGLQPSIQPAYFFDVNEWQTLYTEFNRPKVPQHVAEAAAEEYYNRERIAREVPFLVMDDLGVREGVTEGFRADLHRLVNTRNQSELPSIYTSNVPLQELERIFGEKRLVDRIRDMTEVLRFTGESKRGRRK
jgi:DNA replication protein DnaC